MGTAYILFPLASILCHGKEKTLRQMDLLSDPVWTFFFLLEAYRWAVSKMK